MKISSLIVKNFKGLRDEYFEPKSFSCLVGENNAGKSTVLQALVYALNNPKKIPASMYYDEAVPIVFTLKLEGVLEGDINRLKSDQRVKMTPLVYGGELTLTAKHTVSNGLELFVSKLVPIEERYRDENIKENFKGLKSAAQAKAIIDEAYLEHSAELPEGASPAQTKEYLKTCINGLNADQFEYIDSTLPSGIPASISNLIPEPIYIPAVKNFTDDLKTTQSTSFGRLMGLLLEDLTPEMQDITDTLNDLKKRLNRYEDEHGDMQDERYEKVVELEETIEKFLSENFPSAKVDLEISPPEVKTILSTAQIYIDDGSRDHIDNKGDGVKRSLTFSLLQTYVDLLSRRAEEHGNEAEVIEGDRVLERPLIFLFEEPELYLHPRAQRILFGTLAKISNTHQTVITTHSPLFFEPGVTAQFVRVAKEAAQPKPIGKLYPVEFEIDQENLNTFRMAKYDNSEAAFFSGHIVLYEGESDDFFFRHVAKKINDEWDFTNKNIALVEVGGKGNFSKFRRFFESFGLRVSILSDLDVLVDGFTHLGASEDIVTNRSNLIQSLDRRVEELGTKPVLTGKRVKRKVNNPVWVAKYEATKLIINSIAEAGNVTEAQVEEMNSLFVWENEEARYIALSTDEVIKPELVALLDSLRDEGIYILSKGAIEEYYPDGVTTNCSKPERALKVIEHVQTREVAVNLSQPLAAGRQTEFEQIFQSIFN